MRWFPAAHFSRDVPGWTSASLHRSLNGTCGVNYAQSGSLESARSVIDRLRAAGYLERNAALATADPGQYAVAFTLARYGVLTGGSVSRQGVRGRGW